jgi:hypothetical protein
MMSEEREWYPANWVDESCPPHKARPEDFVVVEDSAYRLGYAAGDPACFGDEQDWLTQPLEPGDVVDFMCCDRLGEVIVTVRRDGTHVVHGAIPPDHNWVTVDGDMDTLRDSFDEILQAIFDPREDIHASTFDGGAEDRDVTLLFARWSNYLPHQFSIEDGKPMFRQVSITTN